jgi:hypothetical protein
MGPDIIVDDRVLRQTGMAVHNVMEAGDGQACALIVS